MKSELNEIRIDSKDLILRENKVTSPILPQTTDQLKRSVIIEGDVEVFGPVYGDKVLVHHGPVSFFKSVFGKEELVVDPSAEGDVIFHNAVGSGQVVSAAASKDRTVFASDVNATRVTLRNCFVGGCVYGDEIILDHCVVLGGAFATKNLSINHSIVGTFNSQSVSIEGLNYLLYPSAFSVEPVEAASSAELYNITLADLMGLFKGDAQKGSTGRIKIDLKGDAQRANLKADDGSIILVHSYSVAGKVLVADMSDFERLGNHFLINAGALSSQLMKEYEVTGDDGQVRKLSLEEIRDFFFKVLDGEVEIRMMDSDIDFEEMKRKFGR